MELIGREPEIERLRLFISGITQGAGETLLLSGDPGVGKTSPHRPAHQAGDSVTCAGHFRGFERSRPGVTMARCDRRFRCGEHEKASTRKREEMTTVNERPADARDMFAAHTMIRREFGLMPGLVRATPAGDTPRVTVIVDHIALLGGFLNGHHSGEDKHIWPRLLQCCPGQCAPVVAVMEEQHDAIHSALLEVGQAALAWRANASAGACDALADAIDVLFPFAAEHLALEEEQVVPLIEKYLTQAEYAAVAQEQGADARPDKLPVLFGMFMYETDPAVLDLVVAEMPAEVQPVIKDLGTAAYANYAQQLYGTATPPRATG